MNENLPEIPAYDLYWKKKLKSLKDISYSSDGNNLLVGSEDGRIYLYDNEGMELWQQKRKDSR
jgi:WD40 repeat protein